MTTLGLRMGGNDIRRTKFTVLANGFRIKGHGSVLPGARVTDFLNKAGDFIALTDAQVWEVATGRRLIAAPFLNVNRSNVELVIPDHAPAPLASLTNGNFALR
jgi:hypothetical protein